MARRPKGRSMPAVIGRPAEAPEATVLDLLDRLLDKGTMLDGELTLGVAGVDLISLRLSALLCAADRIVAGK
jgi:Gas vesicle protein